MSPQRTSDVVQSPNTQAEWQTSTSTDTRQAGLPEICLDHQMGAWGGIDFKQGEGTCKDFNKCGPS